MKKVKQSEEVTINAMHIYSDWIDEYSYKIKLKEIFGFKIHWRGENWHISVHTKEKMGKDLDSYYSYELSHFVYPIEVARIIANKKCKILSFVNTHHHDNFIDALSQAMQASKKIIAQSDSQSVEK